MKAFLLVLLEPLIMWIVQSFALPIVEAVARAWVWLYTLGIAREERALIAGDAEDDRQQYKQYLAGEGCKSEQAALRLAFYVLRGVWSNVAWRWNKDLGPWVGGLLRSAYVWVITSRGADRIYWGLLGIVAVEWAIGRLFPSVSLWMVLAATIQMLYLMTVALISTLDIARTFFVTRRLRRRWPREQEAIAHLRVSDPDLAEEDLHALYCELGRFYKGSLYLRERTRLKNPSVSFRDLWRTQTEWRDDMGNKTAEDVNDQAECNEEA